MRHNWEELTNQLEPFAPIKNEYEVARILGLHRGTVRNAFLRGDMPMSLLGVASKEPESEDDLLATKVSFKETGNEAVLKYKAAEPLTPDEVLKLAEIDPDEWRVTDQRINMWQMGRKAKEVDLTWTDGKADGFVKDEGEINKTYLYQVEVKLTRKNRVAVKTVLHPINFTVFGEAHPTDHTKDDDDLTVLFIADPHFGFRRRAEGLVPIQSREFLNALLTIAGIIKPNVTVWNGDVLDFAEFGSFDTEPELLDNTQMAGIELGWVLSQFRKLSRRQIVIEGNHEVRMQKALVKHLSAAFQLKPIHDLDGHPLMSVPRFLGLDSLDTEWVGGYPSAHVQIGSAKFQHGSIVRKGSGKTISSMINDLTSDRFFGHIHRYEIAQKYLEDEGRSIFVGSPGCACDKLWTPGSDATHNWQLGAFVIHIGRLDGKVASVEHITALPKSPVWFRGHKFLAKSYLPELCKSLPSKYHDWFCGR